MFLGILKKQLILKNIITEEDWNSWHNDIIVDYAQDNHFSELKDNEILRERIQTLDQMAQYVGEYFSKEYIMKHVLQFSEEDVKTITKQIAAEPDPMPREDQD